MSGETDEKSDPTLEEALGDVFDKMQAEDTAEAEASNDETGEAAATKEEERPRGSDGKFTAKKAAQDAPEGETETETEETTGQGVEAEAEPEETPAIEPPASWSAAVKAEFAKLPPIVQQEVLKREADYAKGLEQRTAKLKGYEPIEQALEPIRAQLRLNGIDEATWVRRVVAAEQYLQQNPTEAIRWLAKQYGANLNAQTQQPEEEGEPLDPRVAALQQRIDQLTGYLQQTATSQQLATQGQLQADIDAFKSDPAHPFFEEARQDMALLIQAGRATDMKQAYDMAVWANPAIRAKIREAERAAEEAKRKEADSRRAQEARKAASTNLTTRGTGGGATPSDLTLEEELGKVYDRMQGTA